MLVLAHPLVDHRILDRQERNLADHQPLSQFSFEIKTLSDIGADQNQIISITLEEVIQCNLSGLCIPIVRDDPISHSSILQTGHDLFPDRMAMREDHSPLVLVSIHDRRDRFDLAWDRMLAFVVGH